MITKLVPRNAAAMDPQVLAGGISVFFPAYNDAPSIGGLVRTVCGLLNELAVEFEVVVVNDGSRDQTGAVLQALQAEVGPRLRVVTHAVNQGYGAALRSGFAAARFPWVFYTDGDGQYDPGQLTTLLERAGEGVGLVNGYKLKRHDPAHRVWIGRIYNALVRALFHIRLSDVDCDFRLIRREIVQPGCLRAKGGTICLEIALMAEASGLRTVEAPVRHSPRLHGQSQFFRVAPLWNTLRELTRLYANRVVLPALRRASPGPRGLVNPIGAKGD